MLSTALGLVMTRRYQLEWMLRLSSVRKRSSEVEARDQLYKV